MDPLVARLFTNRSTRPNLARGSCRPEQAQRGEGPGIATARCWTLRSFGFASGRHGHVMAIMASPP